MNIQRVREYLNTNPLIVILIVGGSILTVALTLIEPATSMPVVYPSPVINSSPPQSTLPVKKIPEHGRVPKGIEKAGNPVKDPFKAPDDYLQAISLINVPYDHGQQIVSPAKGTDKMTGKGPKAERIPTVEGIAISGDTYLAIIEYNGLSRPYALGEKVGVYRITRIGSESVSVMSPTGQLEWRMRGL